ncbi:MAG: amidohydrolase family protein [Planctomycetes bacterium]|nr:amidohydrolase family protein [Planctomycetota bacterium]
MNAFLAALFLLQSPAEPTLAIEHVAVIPMDREVVLADQTVIVVDGRITTIGAAAEVAVPDGATRIDGRKRFLMPGLADMHVHVWDENDLYLFVANGVTTVRNMFGAPRHLDWRTRIEAGELIGPRIYTAGPIVDGEPAVWPGSIELTDPDDADGVAKEQKDAGYDFLKPYSRLTPDNYDALVAAGKKHGLPLMGHTPVALGLGDVIDAGQTSVEHLDGFSEAAQRGDSPFKTVDGRTDIPAWKTIDEARLAPIARAMRDAKVWNCPTLVVLQKWAQGDDAAALLARPEMRFVSPFIRAGWEPTSPMNYLAKLPASYVTAAHEALPFQQKAVRALRDAGAGIVAGTDMGNPFVIAGFALHEELAYLVGAGLTPYEALRAATADAARCMKAENDWGTIAVGRRADLVLLSANPLDDVTNAALRVGVVLHGRWLTEDTMRTELERRAAAFDEPR